MLNKRESFCGWKRGPSNQKDTLATKKGPNDQKGDLAIKKGL